MTIENLIQIAGGVHFFIAAANFFLPTKLGYRENLEKVSLIIRQIFTVHAIFIVLVLLGFGTICLCFADELSGRSVLGRFLSGFLALFWLLRVVIQTGYYDRTTKQNHRLGNAVFTTAFLYLGIVFTIAAIFGK